MRLWTILRAFLERIPLHVRYILCAFIVTRFALISIGVLSRWLFSDKVTYRWRYSDYLWLDLWGIWDTEWYLRIAQEWYPSQEIPEMGESVFGFFPLYPGLIRLVSFVTNDHYIAALVISNTAFLVACWFLYRLIRIDSSPERALEGVKWLFVYPGAFLLSSALTESLFLATVVAGFYFARRNRWHSVGLLGLLMSLTRPNGVLLVIAFLYEYLSQRNFRFKEIRPDLLYLLLFPTGALSFALYAYYLTGDLFAYSHAQQRGWNVELVNPSTAAWNILITGNIYYLVHLAVLLGVICAMFLYRKSIRPSYLIGGLVLAIFPLLAGFAAIYSLIRYSVTIFPIYLVGAGIENKYLSEVLIFGSLLFQGFLMGVWVNGILIV